MNNQIYLDYEQLRQGNAFSLSEEIRSDEGRSYEIEDWIGRGGNAAVFRCRERATGEEYAMKFLMNPGLKSAKRFLREVKLLKSIAGDHITKYHGTGRASVRNRMNPGSKKLPFVVIELADGNLQDLLLAETLPLRYEQYAGQFRGLAAALATLHVHAVHRDIKPENILVSGERWLLSDYGLCTLVSLGDEDLTAGGLNIGPKYWLSPEVHIPLKSATSSAVIQSLNPL